MEKHTQDKSMLNTNSISGKELDMGKHADESLNETDIDTKKADESTKHKTPGGTLTGTSGKANITVGMNEDKSTIDNTSSPSASLSEKDS